MSGADAGSEGALALAGGTDLIFDHFSLENCSKIKKIVPGGGVHPKFTMYIRHCIQ